MTAKRELLITPYIPDRTENLGDNTGQYGQNDISKPVKLSGSTCVPCADGDEIYGFVQSVEAFTYDGHSVGGVAADTGREAYATDEVGTMSVGDLAVAGTPTALGTAEIATGPNVKAAATPASVIHRWQVMEIVSGSGAGAKLLLRKI